MGYDGLIRVSIRNALWIDEDDEVDMEVFERECVRMRESYVRIRAEHGDDFPPFGIVFRGTYKIARVAQFTREFSECTFRFWQFSYDLLHLEVTDICGETIVHISDIDFESTKLPRELSELGMNLACIHPDTFFIDREITDRLEEKSEVDYDGGW
jgi:hypothetical protein